MVEKMEFQTESKELLNLMINSIYSNREIFLRELISNASDALDKYKYLELTSNGEVPSKEYEIFIELDKENKTLSISDNGIGMSKNDLIENLGTIAHSGSKDFMKKIKEAKENEELDIIGQFGVGFYSSFIVAKEVEVYTKSLDDSGHIFKSNGESSYTIEDTDLKDTGTRIVLHLKDDDDNERYSRFLDEYTIEDLVKKYSDFVRYPIKMKMKVLDDTTDKKDDKDLMEIKTLNSMIPLWKKNKTEVGEDDLKAFYRNNFADYEDPILSLNLNVEGVVSFNSLVFVPGKIPSDLYAQNFEKGLKLYIKGIFIKDKAKELVPDYLKFIKGLVDTSDLSLNISREMLQEDSRLKKISETIENKVVSNLKDLKEKDLEKYIKFYDMYGDHLMYGIYSSYGFKKNLINDLLIFKHLNSDEYIDLRSYKENMKEGQKYIYFACGSSVEAIKMLPEIERYKKNGYDVLFLTKQIDEFAFMMMNEYEKVNFKNVANHTQDDLTDEEKERLETAVAENKRLLDEIKGALGDKVDEVVISSKLVDSPVCISTKDGLSLNMEKTINEIPGENDAKAIKVLEINPDHAIFKSLDAIKEDEEKVKKYSSVLYDEAMLLEGFEVENKEQFIKNLNDLILESLK